MKNNLNDITERLIKEREYQDYMCNQKGYNSNPSVEGELLMLKGYVDKTINIWSKNPSDKKVLEEFRKMGAIVLRCLENHGCPKRDYLNDFFRE